MTISAKPAPEAIRRARLDNPKLRERDLAADLKISEADLVAAHCGEGVVRIEPRVNDVLLGLGAVGEVMALTRNESAVHEKIGVYENVQPGEMAALVLNEQIDLRIFPRAWAHGFAVEKRDGDQVKRSLQFFDAGGDAVHKIHLREASDVAAFEALVAGLVSKDQSQSVETRSIPPKPANSEGKADQDLLRQRWSAMTNTHEFFGLLRDLKLDRLEALTMAGEDYAWSLDADSVRLLFDQAVETQAPIMCFVGNRGCIQIHSGPVKNIAPMGPWLNVMDPTFHLHLRLDHIREVWGVRKPTSDGAVTSVEAYDAAGEMIIQFFGKRHEGETERGDWRSIVSSLPRLAQTSAA